MKSSTIGSCFRVTVFGESHGSQVGCTIEGVPKGIKIDLNELQAFLARRKASLNGLTTTRLEDDIPKITSGICDNNTDGCSIEAVFDNKNYDDSAYKENKFVPRPSHVDYPAFVRYGEIPAGGGHFSGRLTLPMCFAGYIAFQFLKKYNISVNSHIYSVYNIKDTPYVTGYESCCGKELPVINEEVIEPMISEIRKAKKCGNSIGGIVECAVCGLPVGIGEPLFDGLENCISRAVFGIPAVKGIEFGAGFDGSRMLGSEYNDEFCFEDGKVKTKTNNCGGILGGMSDGMPIIFRAAFKPTPSISASQMSVNLKTSESEILNIHGRHDPCITLRAVPAVEACAAIAIADLLLLQEHK